MGASASNISCARRRPIRQGKHLPQLSWAPKRSRWHARARMSVASSNPTMLPWPTMQPSAASASKSKRVSSFQDGRIPPSGPPICTALMPPGMPPARPSQSSRTVSPKHTS